jgi:YD repeat-containing protein
LIQARAPAFGGNGQYTFGYDTLDNIVSMRLPGKRERTFHYDTRNRLELLRDPSGNGVSGFSYDAAGNLAVRNGQTFTYDMGGQLRSAGDVQILLRRSRTACLQQHQRRHRHQKIHPSWARRPSRVATTGMYPFQSAVA